MILLALSLAQTALTSINADTLPHKVELDCRVVSLQEDAALRFAATVHYSGSKTGENHHTFVLVEPKDNAYPRAETRPSPGGKFSNKPFAFVADWHGKNLTYQFELPSSLGSVDEHGVARMEIMNGVHDGTRLASGICKSTIKGLEV